MHILTKYIYIGQSAPEIPETFIYFLKKKILCNYCFLFINLFSFLINSESVGNPYFFLLFLFEIAGIVLANADATSIKSFTEQIL